MRPKPRITRYIGLSTDTKPNADYGDTFREMDTGTVYMFDGETWHALSTEHEYSGDIVSFKARKVVPMQSVVVDIEPVQDLHGYDHPWPAGGGKNLLDYDTVMPAIGFIKQNDEWFLQTASAVNGKVLWENEAGTSGSISISYSYKYNTTPNQGVRFKFIYSDGTQTDNYTTASETYVNKVATSDANKTLSRINCTYGSGSISTWIKDIQVEIGAPTAFSPYSNICPISGRTGADIEHTGVNVWDEEWEVGQYNNATGLPISANDCIRTKNPIPVKPNVTYRTTYGNGNMQVFFYKADETYIGNAWIGATNLITTPDECALMRFRLASAYGTTYGNDISINYPSTDTAYHAYTGETISVSWKSEAGTVYGGTPDVVSGELVVDRAMLTLNTANMNNNNDYPGWRDLEELPGIVGARVNTPVPATLNIGGSAVGVNTTAVTSGILYLPVGFYKKTQDEWKALAMDIEILLHYATPITYHLTPQEVRTLLGTNNVWSDAGDVTVKVKF